MLYVTVWNVQKCYEWWSSSCQTGHRAVELGCPICWRKSWILLLGTLQTCDLCFHAYNNQLLTASHLIKRWKGWNISTSLEQKNHTNLLDTPERTPYHNSESLVGFGLVVTWLRSVNTPLEGSTIKDHTYQPHRQPYFKRLMIGQIRGNTCNSSSVIWNKLQCQPMKL